MSQDRERGRGNDGGERSTRYRFGPRERGGTLAGWRTGQIVTVALGLVFGVVILRWEPNAAGVAAAIGILVLYGALASVPIAGRTSDEWVPVAVCWGSRQGGGRYGRGGRHGGGGRYRRGGRRMGALRGLRLLRAGWHDMGVVHDKAARTLTAVLSLQGASFALLGPDEQDRRVGAWASVLASLAREGSPVHRVQWVAASFPDDGQGAREYLALEGAGAAALARADDGPEAASAALASYESLLADMDSHACAHDVVLALQVRLAKSIETGCGVLAREVGSIVRLLGDADVLVDRVLGVDDLAQLLARTFEPRRDAEGTAVRMPVADPWPMAMEESWSSLRVDRMIHATFWVAEWPRIEVRSDFLAPLLLGTARSTFSVVMAPLGPDAAIRKVEASRTAELADAKFMVDHLNGTRAWHQQPSGETSYVADGRRGEQSGQRSFPCWLLVHPAASMRSPMTVAKEVIVRCS